MSVVTNFKAGKHNPYHLPAASGLYTLCPVAKGREKGIYFPMSQDFDSIFKEGFIIYLIRIQSGNRKVRGTRSILDVQVRSEVMHEYKTQTWLTDRLSSFQSTRYLWNISL